MIRKNRTVKFLTIGLIVVMSLVTLATIFQERILLYPIPLSQKHVFRFSHGQGFEELFFKHSDSISINALYFTISNPKGLIFYLHGNASNIQRYGRFAIDFTQKGYNVLMYDYRGFGKSKGTISEATFYADAQWLYDSIRQRYNYAENEVIIYGRSLGTGIAAKIAAQNNPRALILETPYYNIADVARRRVPLIPYERLLRYTFRTDLWIKEVKCPIYIFHGTNDWVVPYESGALLKPYVKDSTHFVTIPGGRHNNLRKFSQYHEALQRFLTETEIR